MDTFTPFDQVEYMERLDRMKQLEFGYPMDTLESMEGMDAMESFDEKVERIARVWFEETCPPEDGDNCDPELHNWAAAHPDDQASARAFVGFVLHEAGH